VDLCWNCRKCVCEHCEHVWIAYLCSVKLFPNLEAALKGVFNRVLTKLDLEYNNMGDAGKMVRDAVKGRSGFVFELNSSAELSCRK
jgi:hypothetical protein